MSKHIILNCLNALQFSQTDPKANHTTMPLINVFIMFNEEVS